jgi:hypothetical protein
MKATTTVFANRAFEKINLLTDAAVVFLCYFGLDAMKQWQSENLQLSVNLLMLLNIIAVCLGCFSYYAAWNNKEIPENQSLVTSDFEKKTVGTAAFITAWGFVWWFVPFEAMTEMGGRATLFALGVVIYIFSYLIVLINSLKHKESHKIAGNPFVKIGSNLFISVFIFFSIAFLTLTVQNWHPENGGIQFRAILCLSLFYLPLRIFLLLKPPFGFMELATFLMSFLFLVFQVFGML